MGADVVPKSFYQRKTLDAARNLLGCFLVRETGGKIIRGMVTEAEAYVGEKDLACHASKGRTPRTEVMYGNAGRAYVYLVYGMYHCLNVITEKKDFPAAVLIRAVKIEGVDYKETNGPGKLCRFLKIDKKLNGWDLAKGEKLWLEKGIKIKESEIKKSKRIGVDYAKHCRHCLWRFYWEVKD